MKIRGEISNFTNHYKSGHLYFSLKDEEAQIRCVMFASCTKKLKFRPEDGMKATAHGRASMFVRDGQFIFYVDSLEPDGIGELYLKFEETKKRLTEQGLFDSTFKKPVPRYPKAVGIITSDTGAAIQDIRNVITRRFPLCEMILYPSLVQGKGAEEDLCNGIRYFSSNKNVDTIIIGRGGGSIEDLWAFNSEKLARAIYDCPIPVISAVGHETDFTICDFVSDLRAPTPSAAAELAVPNATDLKRQLFNVVTKMKSVVTTKVSEKRFRLERSAKSRFLQSPQYLIDDKRMYTERLSELMCINMQRHIDGALNTVENTEKRIRNDIGILYERKKSEYIKTTAKLEALNPMSVISRGYSAVFGSDNKVIKSIDDVDIGDDLIVRVTDGIVTANVQDKRSMDNG